MKTLLISPPRTQPLDSNVPSWVELDTGAYPPLGILYLAAAVKKWTDCEVSVIDAQASEMTYERLGRHLVHERFDVVGITALTFTLLDVIRTAKLVRQILPDAHICVGGPHAHLYPAETLKLGIADSVITGEGELSFVKLLERLKKGDELVGIPGLALMRDGKLVTSEPETIEDLDSLPFPDRAMLPIASYHSVLARRSPVTTMMSSRGCPFKCIFCDRPAMGKRFRARSADNVVVEMAECVRLGISEIFFYDDTFTVNRRRVLDICDLIRRRKLRVEWDIRARIDTVDAELLRALKAAGCARIHFGIETGTERIQKLLCKNIDLDQARRVFGLTRKAGITSLAYFMIGNPTETPDEVEATLAFAREVKPDYIHLSVTTPFPGTELYLLALREGVIQDDCWKTFAENPTADFVPPLWLEHFTRDELLALLKRGYREFYLRPTYMVRSLFQIRTLSEFWRKARAGLGLLLGGKRA